ncbi:MAG: outer membrane beta-barrel protein [Sandaracinaceae bacterium]
MTPFSARHSAFLVLTSAAILLASRPASAQSDEVEADASRVREAAIAEEARPVPPALETTRESTGDSTAEAVPSADTPTAQPTSGLHWRFFADAYLGVGANLPAVGRDRGPSFAFAPEDGAGLAFTGLDLEFRDDWLGARLDVRIGSAVPALLGSDHVLLGMAGLKQAYVTMRPAEWLSIDLGQFDTVYGAEVSESWLNPTYTRGALYFIAQPFFHTGLRTTVAPEGEPLEFRVLAVQGWNTVLDNNSGKSLGGQVVWTGIPGLSVSAGYLGGPEQDGMDADGNAVAGASERWRHLADLVVSLTADDFSLSLNGDFVAENVLTADGEIYALTYGAMAAARYAFAPFAVAIRGEILADPEGNFTGYENLLLGTATATLEASPDPRVTIRLDARADFANQPVFSFGNAGIHGHALRAVLGAVVRTDG